MEPRSSGAPGFGGDLTITDRRWHCYVRNAARLVKRAMLVAGCNADVVLTDDRTIMRLNARDRGINRPTNVLTYEKPPEILLALETVRREANAAGKPVAAHLTHLLIHGALHLAGHDHHHAGAARRMETTETRLLARLRIGNPWRVDHGFKQGQGGFAPLDPPLRAQPLEPDSGLEREGHPAAGRLRGKTRPSLSRPGPGSKGCALGGGPGGRAPWPYLKS